MEKLLALYGDKVLGSIKGLDRVRVRGTLRWLAHEAGMRTFLGSTGRLLKDFGRWAESLTKQVRASCEAQAKALGVATVYLQRSGVDKDGLAQEIATRDGRANGSLCMLSAVEPCWTPLVRGSRAERTLALHMGERKCVWIYHYLDHPELGLCHVRLQSWLPFSVHVCLNGRHWLEKQLQREGLAYVKDGNCFPYLADVARAQQLLDAQLQTDWPRLLDGLLLATCPALGEVLAPFAPHYYWSADQTEYATDLMFRDGTVLARDYPRLIRHAITVADTPTVLRFFGRRHLAGKAPAEVSSSWQQRAEGLRIKHYLNRNSVKAYDKSGSILRVETTIVTPREFSVYRPRHDDQRQAPTWQRLRKSMADLHRRCQVSDQCNQRYADTLATCHLAATVKEVATEACNPLTREGRRYRGLNPWRAEDYRLLTVLGKGEWAIRGFRNRDLRDRLYPVPPAGDRAAARRLCAKTTRLLRLLRAHGLIRKVPRTHRYLLTDHGHQFVTALLTASATEVQQLTQLAS